jgi:hypothetical protein
VDFVVCDAGGSTVDTTVYTVDAVNPHLQLKEKKASACESPLFFSLYNNKSVGLSLLGVQAGAIFVDQIAKAHFRRIFSNAGFRGDELKEKVDEATSNFESDTKKEFKDASDAKSIKVGRHSFSNLSLGVRKGKMVLTGYIEFFYYGCIIAHDADPIESKSAISSNPAFRASYRASSDNWKAVDRKFVFWMIALYNELTLSYATYLQPVPFSCGRVR